MNNNQAPSTEESLVTLSETPSGLAGSNKLSLKETLEISSKSLIGLAGLCYVLGLLVVTLHLRKYGLNSLSLSQLHYVTAGVWVMLPPGVGVLYCVFVKVVYDSAIEQRQEQLLKKQQAAQQNPTTVPADNDRTSTDNNPTPAAKDDGSFKKFWKGLRNLTRNPKLRAFGTAIFFPAILFYAAVGLLSERFGIQLSWKSWLFIPAFGTLAFGSASLLVFMLLTGRIKPADKNFMPIVIFAGMAAFLFILYVSFFAVYTYEEIPWSTGGGRPSQVEFVFAGEEKTFLENAGIKIGVGDAPNRTESLKLLLVTESEYIIIAPDGKAISVPASSVKSVVYEK